MKILNGVTAFFCGLLSLCDAATVTADFISSSTIPVTAASYMATGNDVQLSLGFAPPAGTNLTVVKNTGLPFISGQFSNLAHGEVVNLSHGGKTYRFVANYYGGTGNDLVLEWAYRDQVAWGEELLLGIGMDLPVPVLSHIGALSGKTVMAVSAGSAEGSGHSLALCSDGTIAAWGYNRVGQLGNNSTTHSSVPVLVTQSGVLAGKTVVAVSAGSDHSLALCSDGTIAAWGSNGAGQLGDNSTTSSSVPVLVTQSGVLAGKTVVAVSAGSSYSLALCSDGTIAAWGSSSAGQLGNGKTTHSSVPVLVTQSGVLAGKTVVAVSAGSGHSLALCSDGTIAAWGSNGFGRLGDNSTTSSSVPVLVTQSGVLAGKTVVAVSAGRDHSLALCSDGTIAAWGMNASGQLGNNSNTSSSVPVLVTQSGVLAGKTVVAVSAGLYHSLALCSDGTIAAWGSDRLGSNSTASSSVPVLVTQSGVLAGKTVVSVSAGSDHSLALCSDGTIAAWGSSNGIILGSGNDGSTPSRVPELVIQSGVLAGKTVVAVSAGSDHSIALCSDGTIAAWGDNSVGQLGNNSTTNGIVPVLVTQSGVLAGKTVVAVSAGSSYSLALCSDGTIAAWGSNSAGQLGNNSTTHSSVPVLVTQSGVLAGKTVVAVSAGSGHSLALCSDGTIAAWGSNGFGRLGDNSTTSSIVPVLVTQSGVLAGKTVVAVSAGSDHSLALCSDGTIAAWGSNSFGQLGNGKTTHSSVPVLVTQSGVLAGKTVVAVSAGSSYSLALCSNGAIAAWGSNSFGQLGNGKTTHSNVPVLVTQSGVLAGKTVVAVSAGGAHSLALCSDGTIAAWGSNSFGQLGSGTTTSSSVPVLVTQSGVLAGRTAVAVSAGNHHSLALCSYDDSTTGLSNLFLSSSNINPQFNPNTNSYSADVAHDVSSIAVRATALVGGLSVLKVNGSVVVSGNYSHSIPLVVGSNIITILVTAPNGITTETFTLTVTRMSNVSTLSSLTLSSGSLSPVFASSTTSYMASVPNATSSITVRPTLTATTATVRVNGTLVTSGSASQSIPLTVGNNTITVVGTAQDGTTTSTYTMTVTRPPSAISTLTALTLSSGTLSPDFTPTTTSYTAIVDNATSITVKPTVTNSFATVRVNGTLVTSGSASQSIPLASGSNTITVAGTAQDGISTSTYTLTVTRLPFTDSTLSALTLSSGTLSPGFASSTTSYTASVANATTSITVWPTLTTTTAKVRVNGTLVTSGSNSQSIPLTVGDNTIAILGTAEDGVTTTSYTVTVTRAPSAVSTLSALTLSSGTLSPGFASGTRNYTASVTNTTTSITVRPTVTDATATIKVNGATVASGSSSAALPLELGPNTITVVGTSQDGTSTSTYSLVVTRKSAVSSLSGLSLSNGSLSPTFTSDTTSYTNTVSNTVSSITVYPTVTANTSTVRVNGTLVTPGNTSQSIPLAVGSNTVTIVSTAEDGTTSTYTVTVTRAPSAISTLSALTLSNGTLSPSFASGTANYTAFVTNATTSIAVTPTVTHSFATVRVNGTQVTSGSMIQRIPLAVGSNTITIVSTAQDGSTTSTYTVTVTRAGVNLTLDTDGDGIPDWRETEMGTNPTSLDSDADGLSDTYEFIYKGETAAFKPRIGDSLRFDLRELGSQGNYQLVGELPTGLTFNPLTGIIEGKLTGKPLTSSLMIQVLNGTTVVRSIPLVLPVTAYPVGLTGTWQALIYDSKDVPQGLLTTTFTAPGICSASLDLIGPDKPRTSLVTFKLSPGENKASFTINFPASTTQPSLQIALEADGDKAELEGTCSIGELKGFRLARGTELPLAARSYTMLIDHGTQDGIQVPAGMGWATGILSTKGAITLTGQLGDAQLVKASLRLGATGQAILWLKPYLNKLSKVGGILSFNDTGVIPSTSLTKNDSELSWHRVADANELSYPGGFAAIPAVVLIKAYVVPTSAPALAQKLGLISQTFPKIEFDGAGLADLDNTFALPSSFVMDASYKLIAQPIPGRVMAPWLGAINTKIGNFTGTLSVKSPVGNILAGTLSASGVIFPADEGTKAVGAGLIKIPVTGKVGSFRTGALILER